jgi:hypothetical protein
MLRSGIDYESTQPWQTRFEAFYIPVTESGCWLWIGGVSSWAERPYIRIAGKKVGAARAAWMKYKGNIPAGLFVLHRCDVGCCVNPNHLFLGTQLDNMRDSSNKGRQAKK